MTSTATHDPIPPQNPLGGPASQSPHSTVTVNASEMPNPVVPGISIRDVTMPLALLAVFGYFAVMAPSFLSPRNLSMLATEVSITAVLALGMFLVILPGHIDLSAGSGVGLIGGIAAVLIFSHNWPAPLALLFSLAVALLIWLVMGSLIVKERVPAFIITLSGLLIFRGFQWLVIQSGTVPVVRGGGTNIFSLLTTYYVPPAMGLITAGRHFRGHGRRSLERKSPAPRRRHRRVMASSRSCAFRHRAVAAALRGDLQSISRRAVAGGDPRCDRHGRLRSDPAHAVRTLSLRDRRQRRSGIGQRRSRRAGDDLRVCHHGIDRRGDRLSADSVSRFEHPHRRQPDGIGRRRRLRHRRHEPQRRPRNRRRSP